MTATNVDGSVRLFADPLRLRIVSLLAQEQLCTCHLVEETGAKQTTVSHHLKALREAGLVEATPCGRYTYYRLLPEALDRLAGQFGALAVQARAAGDVRRRC
jgi:ArsR family transcriptional regulator